MNAGAPLPVSATDVAAAAARLQGHAVRTALIDNAQLNEIAGGRVLLKLETLQHTGSFKFRGAYNRLAQLDPAQRRAGVVAWSFRQPCTGRGLCRTAARHRHHDRDACRCTGDQDRQHEAARR